MGDDEDCYSCPDDCSSVSGAHCGNAMCEAGDGENCQTCPEDCLSTSGICCGMNGQCDAASRGCRTNMTVMACCGDQQCEGAETASSCPRDCASNEHARPDLVLQHATDSNGRMCEYSSTAGSSFEVIVHHQADSFDASLVARALAMLADQHDVTFASLFVQSEEVDSETTRVSVHVGTPIGSCAPVDAEAAVESTTVVATVLTEDLVSNAMLAAGGQQVSASTRAAVLFSTLFMLLVALLMLA